MARWVKHSGGTVNVPTVIGRDVEDGEEVDVPDDVLLPEEYFRRVEEQPATDSDNVEPEDQEGE